MNVRNSILCFLAMVSIIFFYSGYFEGKSNYKKKYGVVYGKITKLDIETIQTKEPTKKLGCVGIYSIKFKYRLKVCYEYIINKKIYTSYFYNDGIFDDYVENREQIKKIREKYNNISIIKIYYNIINNGESCINIIKMRRKNSLFYYSCSMISFIVLLIILFFSDFFING